MPQANDGTQFSSGMASTHHNARLAAGTVQPANQQPKSIQDDPKAMGLVNQLKALGYTGDDVAQAMEGEQPMDQSAEATKAAPLQIPGA